MIKNQKKTEERNENIRTCNSIFKSDDNKEKNI